MTSVIGSVSLIDVFVITKAADLVNSSTKEI